MLRKAYVVAVVSLALVLPSASYGKLDRVEIQTLVAQKIIIGFFGTKKSDPDFQRVMRNLEDGLVGGVIFLGRNIGDITDLKDMVHDIQSCKCSIAPLIAIDEEGGAIDRLNAAHGFSPTSSAATIGAGNAIAAHDEYKKLADKVATIGFNLNLAPVVDLNVNNENPVIGRLNRSFSDSVRTVSKFASIFIEEHHKKGIATALKHFPGHGSSSNDSHDAVADVQSSWSTDELQPYRNLVKMGLVDCVLVGHLSNKKIWGGPATQNGSSAIDEILRQQIGFQGVILSDDLSMNAMRSPMQPLSHVIASSIQAGVDIVVVSRFNDVDERFDTGKYANDAIVANVLSGTIDLVSVIKSAKRIKNLKQNIAVGFNQYKKRSLNRMPRSTSK
jgi:beta-N-acetylhexosaminidase